ncbi:hypothetical protein [Clostridium felsineum]|uniref:Uncharacterized protein n=1 Tax=Clostridium felsineum TaxID=36839 RepID=A0A1S8KZT7_9CLOT|nr:hypothetical protein [Clostridium felsineum]URZ06493.1 hypothetical protein CLROS_018260 [Clostridium felsineum]URZ11528.1 hypothetical protein CROST_022450 [Clostridium felsineum]
MTPYLIFKDINSLDIKELYIQTFPLPEPGIETRQVSKIQVPGRSGSLRLRESGIYGEDTFGDTEVSITILYRGNNIDFISRWLQGDGKLILSNHTDRYLRAHIDNAIPIEKLLVHNFRTFTVTFTCYPYAFLSSGDVPLEWTPTSSTWKTIIMNKYDLSLPNLKIFGQGDIGMRINGVETDFYSVDQYIECDSELQQCYKGSQNLGMNMSGEFPALSHGKNEIEFTGNIQKVILIPRWRTL